MVRVEPFEPIRAVAAAAMRVSHDHRGVPQRFDHVIHLDRTRALEPLALTAEWGAGRIARDLPHRG